MQLAPAAITPDRGDYDRLVRSMASTILAGPIAKMPWNDGHNIELLCTAGFRFGEIAEALPDVKRSVQAVLATAGEGVV